MDSNLKRSIILEHYQNPFNKGLLEDDSYEKTNVNNESCVDNINLMIKIEDNIIKDIRFDGVACAISTSATSIAIKTLIGKTIEEALDFINEYENMINEKKYNSNILGEAIVYDEIYKQPNRKKCALLPIIGIKRILNDKS
jgi:nitrogen fixation NifU-like protein